MIEGHNADRFVVSVQLARKVKFITHGKEPGDADSASRQKRNRSYLPGRNGRHKCALAEVVNVMAIRVQARKPYLFGRRRKLEVNRPASIPLNAA
jgi:hypothetical protein